MRILISKLYYNIVYRKQMNAFKRLVNHKNLTSQERQELQLAKLKDVVLKAKESVPYYGQLLKDFKEFNYENFQEIPFLTKDVIRKNISKIQSVNSGEYKRVYKNTSGGSTGEPVTFFQTDTYAYYARGSAHFANFLNGVLPYDKKIVLWGAVRDMNDPEKRSLFRRVKDFLSNQRMLNTFVMDEKIMIKYLTIMNRYKPTFIRAYVHSIYELAKFINKNSLEVQFVPIIQTTTGPLYPGMREEIQRAFNNCNVFNYYGSREVSSIASEVHSQDGMLVMYDNIFVEVVDENGIAVEKGEEGEIVVTTLNNEYMPLIRFKIGDRGIKGDDKLFGTMRLSSVLGRTLGVIYRSDGSYIDGQFFVTLFFDKPGIERFQLVQEDLENLVLKIVAGDLFNQHEVDEVLKQIESNLPGVTIHVSYVDKIETASTGKLMYVYSLLSV